MFDLKTSFTIFQQQEMDGYLNIRLRIFKSDDRLYVDIREYMDDSWTKEGICMNLWEFELFLKKLKVFKEGDSVTADNGKRVFKMLKEKNWIAMDLKTPKKTTLINLALDHCNEILRREMEIMDAIEEAKSMGEDTVF